MTATDADGDMAMGNIRIEVRDDAPIAYDEVVQKVGEELREDGNVYVNDILSEDDVNNVTSVEFDGQSYAVSETGVTTIAGEYGTLQISADGSIGVNV